MRLRACVCASPCPLTWAGGQEATHQQGLLVVSQRLFGQVALAFDLHLQGLGHIRHHPVNGPQHKEYSVLRRQGGWGGTLREVCSLQSVQTVDHLCHAILQSVVSSIDDLYFSIYQETTLRATRL